jgi:hypothetical protein
MPDTRTGTTTLAKLSVDRKQLTAAVRILTRNVKIASAGEAILRFVGCDLVIQIGGARASARANGRWPGEARLPGAFLLGAAKLLPADDPVPIRVEAGHLYIARSSVKCVWQRFGAAKIELPIDATLPMLVRIAREHTREAIEASGIAKVVDAAFAEESELIKRAALILAQLGVTEEEVRRLAFEHRRG